MDCKTDGKPEEKMEFSYKIYRDCDNTLLVEGFTQNVFTSKATGHILR